MPHIARVNEDSRDRALRGDGEDGDRGRGTLPVDCASASARARSVENSDGAVPGPYETVSREGRVTGKSRDFPRWRDIEGDGALVGACARARSIECGEGGLASSCGKAQPERGQANHES